MAVVCMQEEEVETLEAIYGGDFLHVSVEPRVYSISVATTDNSQCLEVQVTITVRNCLYQLE